MSKFIENESYLHKKAKEVFKEWLDDSYSKESMYNELDFINFRSNRDSGVFLEYPICKGNYENNYFNSWNENWDEIINYKHEKYWKEYVPSYDECINNFNSYPIAIIDVVVSHKGSPCYGIEIKYKNPTSEKKINNLISYGVDNLIEIDAKWILQKTRKPEKLEYTKLI
jgi:hypothetical protein